MIKLNALFRHFTCLSKCIVVLFFGICDDECVWSVSTFSTLANWENSELQVVAKHRSTFSKDKIIGIAVFPFVSIIKEASLTLGLCPSLALSDRGQAILNVLSVRTFDNFARDFVALKNFHQKSSSPENLDQDSGL